MSDQRNLPARRNAFVGFPMDDVRDIATHAAKSGLFKDARDGHAAVVKMLLGREYGFSPMQSLTNIHTIDGKPVLSAAAMSALIRRSGNLVYEGKAATGYDYAIQRQDAKGCVLEFFRVIRSGPNVERIPLGVSSFVEEDAKRAGLLGKSNWNNYPAAMYFARAVSQGTTYHTPDLIGGPAYINDEMGGDEYEEVPYEVIQDAQASDVDEVAYADVNEPDAAPAASGDGQATTEPPEAPEPVETKSEPEPVTAEAVIAKAQAAVAPFETEVVNKEAVEAAVNPTAAGTTESNEETDDEAKARRALMAEGSKVFGKQWDESKKGKRDGRRHEMVKAMTDGRTDSVKDLSLEEREELRRLVTLAGLPPVEPKAAPKATPKADKVPDVIGKGGAQKLNEMIEGSALEVPGVIDLLSSYERLTTPLRDGSETGDLEPALALLSKAEANALAAVTKNERACVEANKRGFLSEFARQAPLYKAEGEESFTQLKQGANAMVKDMFDGADLTEVVAGVKAILAKL